MEQDSNHSGLCKSGCGFYANHSYDGMCSKCYKDQIKKQQQTTQNAAGRATPPSGNGACGSASAGQLIPNASAIATSSDTITSPPINIPSKNNDLLRTPVKGDPLASLTEEASSPSSLVGSMDDSPSESPSKLKKRNRCYSCKKKVGLTGFECRCGGLFCGLHRYSDKHNCSYDYKADGREAIAKANPVIVGEKIKKI